MCFAPQRRTLFRHRNFQKWPEHGVFCTFWLWNVLRATTACTFSTSQLPKVVRTWCVLYILLRATMACNFSSLIWPAGSAPAPLVSLLFDPPEPQSIGKHRVSRLSYLFAHLHLLSSDSFFWLLLLTPSSDSFFWLLLLTPFFWLLLLTPFFWLLLLTRSSDSFSSLIFSLLFSSLLFSSLPFASLRFPSLRFPSLRFPSLRFASLRSLLFSSLLFSSLLFSSPPLLFICPYCRKFDFQTSFG